MEGEERESGEGAGGGRGRKAGHYGLSISAGRSEGVCEWVRCRNVRFEVCGAYYLRPQAAEDNASQRVSFG